MQDTIRAPPAASDLLSTSFEKATFCLFTRLIYRGLFSFSRPAVLAMTRGETVEIDSLQDDRSIFYSESGLAIHCCTSIKEILRVCKSITSRRAQQAAPLQSG